MALFQASRLGDVAKVTELLSSGATVNAGDDYGRTPLMGAVDGGHEATARLLLESGAMLGLNLADSYKRTALMVAVRRGVYYTCWSTGERDGIARMLLDAGAYADVVDFEGNTPLMYASMNGTVTLVRLLLDHGASMDMIDGMGKTAIMLAVVAGRRPIVRLLLERGASIDKVCVFGRTVYEIAIGHGQVSLARMVLSYGSEPAEHDGVPVPLLRDCRRAVEESVLRTGDRDVARLCGDFVSMVDRW